MSIKSFSKVLGNTFILIWYLRGQKIFSSLKKKKKNPHDTKICFSNIFLYSVKNNFSSSRAVLSNYHPAHLNIFKIIFEIYYQNRRPKCNVPNLLKFCLQKFRKRQRLCHLHQKAVANGRLTANCPSFPLAPSPMALSLCSFSAERCSSLPSDLLWPPGRGRMRPASAETRAPGASALWETGRRSLNKLGLL